MDSVEFMILKYLPPLSKLRDEEHADLLNLDPIIIENFFRMNGIDAFMHAMLKFKENSDIRSKFDYFENKYFVIEPENLENAF